MASRARKHTDIEDFSFGGTQFRMAPAGLWFYGTDFMRAAKAIAPVPDQPFSPAKLYLVCHAIELLLKAFLSSKGSSLENLAKGSGHDLTRLLSETQRAGLDAVIALSEEQRREIVRASRYYGEKVFEYPAVRLAYSNYPDMPDVDGLLDAAEALAAELRLPCLRA